MASQLFPRSSGDEMAPLRTLAKSDKTDINRELEKRGVRFVRLLWIDAAGVRRTRVVPAARFAATCAAGVGLSFACLWLPAWGDAPPDDPAAVPVGEFRLTPDLATLRQLPWHPAHAAAASHCVVAPPDGLWGCCPRTSLARVLALAERSFGLQLRVGYETEFVLLQKREAGAAPGALPPPLDSSVYCQSSSFDGAAAVLDEVCAALGALGITLEQLHPESAPGQFELAAAPAAPLQAVDDLLFTKEAICAVAVRNGLVASFLPKLADGAAGNGLHMHFSVWRGGDNLFAHDPAGGACSAAGGCSWGFASAEGEAFLAGVLAHLPALMVFSAPSPNSYRRLLPHHWAGAFRCWGFNNREAPLRLCPGPPGSGGAAANCELKAHDATANPYIALAALVVAGLEGIKGGLSLPRPVQVDPGRLGEAARAAAGATRLPAALGEALDALVADDAYRHALDAAFGTPDLVRAFVAVRRSELEALGGLGLEEEAARLYDRY